MCRFLLVATLLLTFSTDAHATRFTDRVSFGSSLAVDYSTIPADATTVDVGDRFLFVTSANTVVTALSDLTNTLAGQVLTICGGSSTNATTISSGGYFTLPSGTMTLSARRCIVLWVKAYHDYVELARSGDVPIGSGGEATQGLVYRTARTTDAAPYTLAIRAGDAWTRATSTSQTGGTLRLCGGIGTMQVTVSSVGSSAGDTYAISIDGTTTTLTARNGGAAAHEWNCQTSNASCALALKAAVNTEALAITASCLDSTCSDGKVYLQPTATSACWASHAITDNAGGAFGTVTSGATGKVALRSNLLLRLGTQVNELADGRVQVVKSDGTNVGSLQVGTSDANGIIMGIDSSSTLGIFKADSSSYGFVAAKSFTAIAADGFKLGTNARMTSGAVDEVNVLNGSGTTFGTINIITEGFIERTAPAAPAADGVKLYAQDSGGGKTQLCALFASGEAQCFATQP